MPFLNLDQAGLGENALLIPENNKNNEYYWMLNRYSRKVPISVRMAGDALQRGFIHTDRKICSDNPEDSQFKQWKKGQKNKVSSEERIASAVEKTAEVITELKRERSQRPKAKKDEEIEEK